MEGYDVVPMGYFYGFPAFNKIYGQLIGDGSCGLSAPWQAGVSGSYCCLHFILVFPHNVQTLVAGEVLMNIPFGVYQTLTVTYPSEVCPVALRARSARSSRVPIAAGPIVAACSSVFTWYVESNFSQCSDKWNIVLGIPIGMEYMWDVINPAANTSINAHPA